VSLPIGRWIAMTALVLVALLPFAALGIVLGHLMTADSIGPATGGLVALLALISGTWFPLGNSGFLHDVAQYLPSYWLVQAGHVALGGDPWGSKGRRARSLAARDFLRAPLFACSAPRLTARSIVETSVRSSPSARSVSPSPTAASSRRKYVFTDEV
jgi:hypothetical protein